MAEKDLIPLNKRTKAEQQKIARKGGIKSGEVRRERKKFKEALLDLLENGNIQNNILAALLNKAQKGDIKAFEVLRDTIGEKPVDKKELTGKDGDPIIIDSKLDTDALRALADSEYMERRKAMDGGEKPSEVKTSNVKST